ncbi:hypothetical protein WJ85_05640 [Burkholderia ubonensis]|nr:hypothetical protein WJ85_05640 [Burkholderia ubonensis]
MLARRCGITVRALHYYDQTGLLKPIGRSTSGYRLYDEASVSTIRTIQALRGLGLTLDAIAQMLRNRQIALAEVIAESRLAIDAELARLNTLNERLGVLQAACDSGVTWLDADWPETLALLERYRAHFNTAEIAKILARWKDMEAALSTLFADVRDAMNRHVPPASGEAQKLAYRWLAAAMQWMDGDIAIARRWRQLHDGAAPAPDHTGLDRTVIAYIEQATRLQVAAWRRHLTEDDIQRLERRCRRNGSHSVQTSDARSLAAQTMETPPRSRAVGTRCSSERRTATSRYAASCYGHCLMSRFCKRAIRWVPTYSHGFNVRKPPSYMTATLRLALDPHVDVRVHAGTFSPEVAHEPHTGRIEPVPDRRSSRSNDAAGRRHPGCTGG